MRKLIPLILLTAFSVNRTSAQDKVSANQTATAPTAVTGKIVDGTTGKPVEYASVVLLRFADSSLLTGVYTTPDGLFTLPRIPAGDYVLRVTFMGYDKFEQKLQSDADRSLGELKLTAAGTSLAGVEIKSEKPEFSMQIDRQVFDMSNMLAAAGGTASDVMKYLPGVESDIDENVTMRGKSITVYVDGKPSPFGDTKTALQMIPSETIDKIELIHNPSAKFDAAGGGGIINIVLKKDKAMGYNYMINVSAANPREANGSVNASLRLRKINFFGNFQQRYNQQRGSGYSYRKNMKDTVNYFIQESTNRNINKGSGGRFGFDYYLDNHTTLTFAGGWNHWDNNNRDSSYMNYQDEYMQQQRYGFRNNTSGGDGLSYNTNFNFKRTFDKPNQELTAYVNYSDSKGNSGSQYRTNYERPDGTVYGKPSNQVNDGENHNRFLDAQADYTTPYGKKGKFEAGGKYTTRNYENLYVANLFDYNTGNFVISPLLSNNYSYREKIGSGYVNAASAIGNLGYQVGLRVENSQLTGYSFSKDTSVNNSFLNVFPSLFLKYNLPNDHNLIFNYSTRIDRPDFNQLLPYINNSDTMNIRVGNPGLKPAFTHKFELNYGIYFPKTRNYFSTGFYYSTTNKLIDRLSLLDPKTGITTTSPQNLATNNSFGSNTTYKMRIFKWWTHTTTFNLEYSHIFGQSGDRKIENENLGYSINLNSNFRLPFKFSGQIVGSYRSPRVMPQGTYKAMNGVDISIRKEFFKNNALSVSASLADVFNTRQFASHYETPDFIQDYDRTRTSRIVKLNVRYRFAKIDPNLFRKKKVQKEEEEEEAPAAPKTNGRELGL
ncbi:TonB-dependent receptor family protein [Chitinophaga horti]|uniref:TonB-dependent receptor family protein n=1 Tax=Chitinophaga horti TaxID=2920382 RepID=A0ABY6IUL2_9BACT|nr:TonB-dependent receptor family protein [Chitinophaga horti]UYQ91056.1 TonB-dependent receptor family protein [Chitinophaga horti]